MAVVKAEAKVLCRATDYAVWAQRPLPALLIEYATDCRFFPGLHARYEAELLRLCGADAVRCARVLALVAESVERRVAAARSTDFSGDNRNNGRSDGRLTRAVQEVLLGGSGGGSGGGAGAGGGGAYRGGGGLRGGGAHRGGPRPFSGGHWRGGAGGGAF